MLGVSIPEMVGVIFSSRIPCLFCASKSTGSIDALIESTVGSPGLVTANGEGMNPSIFL